MSFIGAPISRIDGHAKVTGAAKYAAEPHVADLAHGSVVVSRIAKGRIATVAVNEFVFKQPVSVGDLLSFYAHVLRVGRTSVTVRVEVYAERNPADLKVVKVTEANLTYVAIDAHGQPRELPRA